MRSFGLQQLVRWAETETAVIAEHIAQALRAAARGDDDTRWEHVQALHRDGSDGALQAALGLCDSADPQERALGADILGQLGGSGPSSPYRQQVAPTLARLLDDRDTDVVSSALFAHGHLYLQAEAAVLGALAAHPSADVRHAVACALPTGGGPAAVPLLMRLMRDTDDGVRDWATFGLGAQTEEDSAEIRDALLERTQDSNDDTRGEAVAGLARRRDRRVVATLLGELRSQSVGRLTVEAARDIAARELLPALEALSTREDVDATLLAEAIDACRAGQ